MEDIRQDKGIILHWVNSAKGIGVVLIIVGHLLFDSNIPYANQIIYSFHMPLFFILSGYIQKCEFKDGFLKKRAKQLLLPFVAFTVIGAPFFAYVITKRGGSLLDVFLDLFYVKGQISNSPLWFLIVFFEVCVVIFVMKIPLLKTRVQIVCLVISFFSGVLVYYFEDSLRFLYVFGMNRAIVCLSFYILGMLLRKINEKYSLSIPTLFLAIAMNIVFGIVLNSKVSIYSFFLGSYYCFYAAAVGGSLGVMVFCKRFLDKEGVLEQISKYSILLLGSQYFFIRPYMMLIRKFGVAKTVYYDVMMLIVALFVVWIVPIIYETVKKKVGIISVFNGEVC